LAETAERDWLKVESFVCGSLEGDSKTDRTREEDI